jgi:hypothetical protein
VALSDHTEIDPTPEYHRRGCQVGRWAQTLPERDRLTLERWLADKSVPHSVIAKAINDDPDYPVNFAERAIAYHRNGCRCGAV